MEKFVVYEVRVKRYAYIVEAVNKDEAEEIVRYALATGSADEFRFPEYDDEDVYFKVEKY